MGRGTVVQNPFEMKQNHPSSPKPKPGSFSKQKAPPFGRVNMDDCCFALVDGTTPLVEGIPHADGDVCVSLSPQDHACVEIETATNNTNDGKPLNLRVMRKQKSLSTW